MTNATEGTAPLPRLLSYGVIVLAVVAMFFACIRPAVKEIRPLDPLHPADPFADQGGFIPDGFYPTTGPLDISSTLQTRGSWVNGDAFQGRYQSPWFEAAPGISLMLAGYPSLPPNRLEVHVRHSDGSVVTHLFNGGNPGEQWWEWKIASAKTATAVRVEASDASSDLCGWLAFSYPFINDNPAMFWSDWIALIAAFLAGAGGVTILVKALWRAPAQSEDPSPFVPATAYPLRQACLVSIAVVSLLFLRRPEAFINPQFFAEDGAVFFAQADLAPAFSISLPYAGYYHLLQRLTAYVAHGLDIRLIPTAYFWVSIAMVAALVFAIHSPRFGLRPKWLLALGVTLVPHAGEVFHNLTNIQWISALGLVVLLLAEDGRRVWQRTTDVAAALVIGLTGVFSILWAPLFWARAIRRRSAPSIAVAIAITLAAAIQLRSVIEAPYNPLLPGDSPLQPIDPVRLTGHRVWLALLMGPHSDSVPREIQIVACVSGIAAMLMAILFQRKDRWPLLVLAACSVVITAATFQRFSADIRMLSVFQNGDRYFFLPKVLIVWTFIHISTTRNEWRWPAVCFLAAVFLASLFPFRYPKYQDFNWPYWAARIEAGEPASIPVNPAPFAFDHQRPPR